MTGSPKRDRSPFPALSPSPSQPRPAEQFTLRVILEARFDRASERFTRGGIADIEIDNADADAGIVAHQSLVQRLSVLDVPASEMPKSLVEAISKGLALDIITHSEAKWLNHSTTRMWRRLWPACATRIAAISRWSNADLIELLAHVPSLPVRIAACLEDELRGYRCLITARRWSLQERKEENKRFVVIERGPTRRSIGLQVEAFWNGMRLDGEPGRFIGMTVAKAAGAAVEAGLKEGDLIVSINGISGSAVKMCDEALRSQTVVFELQSKDKYKEPIRRVAGYLLRPGMPSEFPFEQMLKDRRESSLTKGYP